MTSTEVMNSNLGCWDVFLYRAVILCRRYASGSSQLHMLSDLGLGMAWSFRFSTRDNAFLHRPVLLCQYDQNGAIIAMRLDLTIRSDYSVRRATGLRLDSYISHVIGHVPRSTTTPYGALALE